MLNSEGRPVDRDRGQNLAILLDVADEPPLRRQGDPIDTGGHGVRKGDCTKVGKGNIMFVSKPEVFDNPLCILPTEWVSRAEGHGLGLASGEVLDYSDARCQRKRSDIGSDGVSSRDGEVPEFHLVGVPLVPSYSSIRWARYCMHDLMAPYRRNAPQVAQFV